MGAVDHHGSAVVILWGCRCGYWREREAHSVKLTASVRVLVRVLGNLELLGNTLIWSLFQYRLLVADRSAGEKVMSLLVAAMRLLHECLLVLIENVYLMTLSFIRLTLNCVLIMTSRVFLNKPPDILSSDVNLTNVKLMARCLIVFLSELVDCNRCVWVTVHQEILPKLFGVVIVFSLLVLHVLGHKSSWARVLFSDIVVAGLKATSNAWLVLFD